MMYLVKLNSDGMKVVPQELRSKNGWEIARLHTPRYKDSYMLNSGAYVSSCHFVLYKKLDYQEYFEVF